MLTHHDFISFECTTKKAILTDHEAWVSVQPFQHYCSVYIKSEINKATILKGPTSPMYLQERSYVMLKELNSCITNIFKKQQS